jgi:hypothetical protein
MTGFACKQISAMIAPVTLFLGLQAIKGYEALQQRHKMDVHTYFHLVPLLVAELRPPTAAALPLRLLATLVHAKAHARAWAAMHAGWLRELPRRESHKVRRAVVCCFTSFALHHRVDTRSTSPLQQSTSRTAQKPANRGPRSSNTQPYILHNIIIYHT